jgi:AP-3 complex subunit mu
MPWRKTGVKYAQNEIYLDIVEEVDCLVDRNGNIISSEVSGSIQGNCRLSGVPDLLLSFADPSLIDDCSFHPCVRSHTIIHFKCLNQSRSINIQ